MRAGSYASANGTGRCRSSVEIVASAIVRREESGLGSSSRPMEVVASAGNAIRSEYVTVPFSVAFSADGPGAAAVARSAAKPGIAMRPNTTASSERKRARLAAGPTNVRELPRVIAPRP